MPSLAASDCPFPWLRPRIPANRRPRSTHPGPGTRTIPRVATRWHAVGQQPARAPCPSPKTLTDPSTAKAQAATMIVARWGRLNSYNPDVPRVVERR